MAQRKLNMCFITSGDEETFRGNLNWRGENAVVAGRKVFYIWMDGTETSVVMPIIPNYVVNSVVN